MTKLTPFAVVYKSEVYICVDENETRLFITNKGLNVLKGVIRLIINKNEAQKTLWDCSKLCEENGIKWEGNNESSSSNKGG
jgi:predicted peroxiredoxin